RITSRTRARHLPPDQELDTARRWVINEQRVWCRRPAAIPNQGTYSAVLQLRFPSLQQRGRVRSFNRWPSLGSSRESQKGDRILRLPARRESVQRCIQCSQRANGRLPQGRARPRGNLQVLRTNEGTPRRKC